MRFELCKWEFKPILMNVEYRTNDRLDFIKNMIALIKLIELENNICINRENMFDYIQIFDLKNNLQNNELLDYLENESLESLDKLEI